MENYFDQFDAPADAPTAAPAALTPTSNYFDQFDATPEPAVPLADATRTLTQPGAPGDPVGEVLKSGLIGSATRPVGFMEAGDRALKSGFLRAAGGAAGVAGGIAAPFSDAASGYLFDASQNRLADASSLDLQPGEKYTGGGYAGAVVGGLSAALAEIPFTAANAGMAAVDRGASNADIVKEAAVADGVAALMMVAPELGGRVGSKIASAISSKADLGRIAAGVTNIAGKMVGGAGAGVAAGVTARAAENAVSSPERQQPLMSPQSAVADLATGAAFGLTARNHARVLETPARAGNFEGRIPPSEGPPGTSPSAAGSPSDTFQYQAGETVNDVLPPDAPQATVVIPDAPAPAAAPKALPAPPQPMGFAVGAGGDTVPQVLGNIAPAQQRAQENGQGRVESIPSGSSGTAAPAARAAQQAATPVALPAGTPKLTAQPLPDGRIHVYGPKAVVKTELAGLGAITNAKTGVTTVPAKNVAKAQVALNLYNSRIPVGGTNVPAPPVPTGRRGEPSNLQHGSAPVADRNAPAGQLPAVAAGGTPDQGVRPQASGSGAVASQPAPDGAAQPAAGVTQAAPNSLQAPKSSGVSSEPQNPAEWHNFPPESKSLNVPRAEMPQVKAEHRGALVNFLAARGVKHLQQTVDPHTLKPTQAEFSPEKVSKAENFVGEDRAILVSSDNRVVDGHHQLLAAQKAGTPIRVIRLVAPVSKLLPLVHEFPSSTVSKATVAQPTIPQPAAEQAGAGSTLAQPAASAQTIAHGEPAAPAQPTHVVPDVASGALPELERGIQQQLEREVSPEERDRGVEAFQVAPGTYERVEAPSHLTRLVSAIQRAFGKKVVFFKVNDPEVLKNFSFDGVVMPSDPHTLYLWVDAERPHRFVAFHELFHTMEKTDPELYAALRKSAVSMGLLKNRAEYATAANISGASPNTITSEMLADFFAHQANDENFFRDVADHMAPSAMRQFLSKLQDVLQKFLKTLRGMTTDRIDMREFTDDLETLSGLLKKFTADYLERNPVASDTIGGENGQAATYAKNRPDAAGDRRSGTEPARMAGWSARPAHPSAVRLEAVHHSNTAGLSSLSGLKYGTQGAGAERARIGITPKNSPLRKRVYFYDAAHPIAQRGESMLGQAAKYKQALNNLYDGAADPLDLRGKIDSKLSDASYANAFENAVIGAGFDGYVAKQTGMAVVIGVDEVPVLKFSRNAPASAREIREGRVSMKKFGLDIEANNTNRDVATALDKYSTSRRAEIARDDFSEKASVKIAHQMADEILFEIDPSRVKESALGWYTKEWDSAKGLLTEKYPQLKDPQQSGLFTLITAVTSDGTEVTPNLGHAIEIYDQYTKTGRVETTRFAGPTAPTIKENVRLIGRLVEDFGLEKTLSSLAEQKTLKEWAAEGVDISGYLLTTKMPRAMAFGPKLGAYFMNLSGDARYLTMDRWFCRTFNRMRGNMLPDITEGKLDAVRSAAGKPGMTRSQTIAFVIETSKEMNKRQRNERKAGIKPTWTRLEKVSARLLTQVKGLVDTPQNKSEREFMIQTVERAAKILMDKGFEVTPSDVQAILWYNEKRLFKELGATAELKDDSYADAARKLLGDRGVGSGRRDVSAQEQSSDPGENAGVDAAALQDRVDDGLKLSRNDSAGLQPGGMGRDSGLAEAQRVAAQAAGSAKKLEGLPDEPLQIDGKWVVPGPFEKAHTAAADYMRKAGLPYRPVEKFLKVDPARSTRIADAFEAMPHAPDDPAVKDAYAALIREVVAQYQAVKATGLKVEFIPVGAADPYAASPRLATDDVVRNNHFWVFPTDSGFGSGEALQSPMLDKTDEKIGDRQLLANDIFRIVHDYFGHIKDGVGFRAGGEENAWASHAAMFSPLARKAVTTETRGQNSWVNYGPHGEANRTASAADTIYAPQKVGLLPDWAVDEGLPKFSRNEPEKPFYSALTRGVESSSNTKAPAKQWQAFIKNLGSKGVKADELAWSGVDQWLDQQTGVVTKQQLVDYLRSQEVQVKEVMKGDSASNEMVNKIRAMGYEVHESEHGTPALVRNGNEIDVEDLPPDAYRAWEALKNSDADNTKFASYQTPGGKNYRELLLTLPTAAKLPENTKTYRQFTVYDANGNAFSQGTMPMSERTRANVAAHPEWRVEERDAPDPNEQHRIDRDAGKHGVFKSGHFDEPNILAHVRFNERTDADGKRVLFVEEVQSDWHQKGRKSGYQSNDPALAQRLTDADAAFEKADAELKAAYGSPMPASGENFYKDLAERTERNAQLQKLWHSAFEEKNNANHALQSERIKNIGAIPDAPFKSTWPMLAMKRMIRYASENGFDRIAWTTGEQQAARYDLSKQIDSIIYDKNEDGTYTIGATKDGRDVVQKDSLTESDLEELIGKEVTKKIVDGEGASAGMGTKELSGVDLKVGGEGMRAFYDKMLPNEVNKYVKKWGGKVGQTKIRTTSDKQAVADDQLLRDLEQNVPDGAPRTHMQVHSLDITDPMRESAMQGQPLFSRNQASWDAPEPSKLDNFIYAVQDKHVDTKRVLESINKIAKVSDATDPRLKEELYHGRVAKRTQDFAANELRPLLQDMAARNVEMTDLEEYLWARHAEERNVQIAKINPKMPDGGSGMKTADARAYLAALTPTQSKDFKALAAKVDGITKGTRQALIDDRLETPATIAAWNGAYSNYVPLMREDKEGGPGTGQGFSVKGSSSRRATGSNRPVVDIVANIAMARERAITRGEKNRVSTALVGLAESNPNPDFWQVDVPPTITDVNKRTGLVETRIDPTYKNHPNVVMARVAVVDKAGKVVDVVDRAVVFDENDERALRMSTALKNLDVDDLGVILGTFGKLTRYFSSVNTQYNPVFGIWNLLRDTSTAALNLTSTPIAGKQTEVFTHTMSAVKYFLAGKFPAAWQPLWEEFQNVGGATGYRDLFATSQDRADAIRREIKQIGEGKLKTAGRAMGQWLSDFNEVMENSTRLAAYKVARDSGLTKERAASLAKNLTVNFNRKGQSTWIGALYGFFNASVQGNARMAETLAGPAGKKILIGGIMLGVLQAVLLAAAGFDDNDPPEFIKQRNLIIPIGGKKYIPVPIGLGFNVIPSIGRLITEGIIGGGKQAGSKAFDLLGMMVNAFDPIGGGSFNLQAISPTATDPLVALATNTDWTGKPIAKEDFNSMAPTPGPSRAKDTATWLSKRLSEGINAMFGGDKYVPGHIGSTVVSPTPDQIDYLAGQFGGGVWRELSKLEQTATAAVTGEDLPSYKIPIVGRLYGNADSEASQANTFYENVKRMNLVAEGLRGRAKDGLPTAGYIKDHPEFAAVGPAQAAARIISALRKQRSINIEKGNREMVKIQDQRITTVMKNLNDLVAKIEEAP